MQRMKKMSYDDFWFIDTRVQTRNLRRWLIWFILLFAFVTVGTVLTIRAMYHDIERYDIIETNPTVAVSEAKATNVNGYIKGEIKNDDVGVVPKKYLGFVLLDENNEVKGTEYLEIPQLAQGETKTFELQFKRDNVERYVIFVINEKPE